MSRSISMMVFLCTLLLAVLSGCSGGGDSAGPVATTVWQQVNAPEGGRITALAVDPADHLTVYAATNNGGFFRSTDGGASWSQANSGLGSVSVGCIALDPTYSQTIYAGTDSGLYKSTNAGASWFGVNSGLQRGEQFGPERILSISIDATDSRNIFVGAGFGVYKTSDAGRSWSPVYSGLCILSVAVDPGNGQIVYAGTSGAYGSESGRTQYDLGILKSVDGGRSWQTVKNDWGYFRSIIIDPANSSIVYAFADSGFFKSTDGGASWDQVSATSVDGAVIADQTVYGLSGDSLSSSSDGVRWNVLGTPLAGTSALSLAVDPTNSRTIYAGTVGAGVFKSIDGGISWSAVNNGLTATIIRAAVITESGGMQNIYVGTQSGIFRSTDDGASWSVTNGRQPDSVNSLAVDPRTSQTMYAGRVFGGVSKSVNGGESWSAVNEGLSVIEPDGTFVYHYTQAVAVDPADGSIYAGTDAGVFKSSNAGGSWSAAGAGLTGFIQALAIDPAHEGVVYAGTADGVYKTVDGGASWKALKTGLPPYGTICSLVVDPSNTKTIYAATWSEVYRSTDGGNSWILIKDNMVYGVAALAIDATTQTLYAGTRGALYKTTDRGSSWRVVSMPVTYHGDVTAIAIKGTTLFAVTNGGAVFKGSTTWQ